MLIATFESCETFTQAQFAEWVASRDPRDLHRAELLNGRIVMNPPVGWPYGEGEADTLGALHQHTRKRRLGRVFSSSQGFELPSGDTVAPDASFVAEARWRQHKPESGKFLRLVPDLVVEVLSPGTASRDRGEKKTIYERNGVREYWLVDVRAEQVTRFVLRDGVFDAGTVFTREQTLTSEVIEGFALPVADVLPAP